MKKSLIISGFDLYCEADTPCILANKVLTKVFNNNLTVDCLPINPFEILVKSGAYYTFLDFKNFEGFYLLPEKDSHEKLAMVGIKRSTRITRQRFTAAHELCHHLKDNITTYCKTGDTNPKEVFANKFAIELLMPEQLVKKVIAQKGITQAISRQAYLEQVLEISVLFGVSFHATLIRVSTMIPRDFLSNKYQIKDVAKKFKPDTKMKELGLSNEFILYKQAFDDAKFFNWDVDQKTQNTFLRLLIGNDSRIENGTMDLSQINEILAEIRYRGIAVVKQYRKLNDSDIEIIGQYEMYTKVFETLREGKVLSEFISLHKKFYRFAPFPDAGGSFRTATARIAQKNISTCDPKLIATKVYELSNEVEEVLKQRELFSNSDLLEKFAEWHHRLTVIHPFVDGNGRTIRAFLNMQLYTCSYPLFYIEEEYKKVYEEALEDADFQQNYEKLFVFLVKNIFRVYAQIQLETD